MLEDSYSNKDTIYTERNVYHGGTSITKSPVERTIIFLTPVIVKFKEIWKKTSI